MVFDVVALTVMCYMEVGDCVITESILTSGCWIAGSSIVCSNDRGSSSWTSEKDY